MIRRALALAAALLGLLLMHGVGGHSAHAGQVHSSGGHADAAGAHAAGAAHAAGPHGAHPVEGATVASYDAAHAATSGPDAAHASCTGSCAEAAATPLPRQVSEALMTLCLTILLTAAGLLLLGGHWRRRWALRSDRVPVPSPPAAARRVLRPPDLHALSVLRC